MSNKIFLSSVSASASQLPNLKKDMDLAAAKGFSGVRFSVGLSGYGGSATVDTSYVTQAVTYAAGLNLMCILLLNYDPKPNDSYILGLNGGVTWNTPTRPPAGTGNALWTWIATARQSLFDAGRAAMIAAGKDPTTQLKAEWSNEQCKGGNKAPKNLSGGYDAPYSGYADGFLEPAWFTMARFIENLMNYHGVPSIVSTLEASGSTSAQTEVDSWTGADCVALLALGDEIDFNRYCDAPATPYSAALTKAGFDTKIQAQITRMRANAAIGAKTINLMEFGLDRNRCPSCTKPNTVRSDLVAQVKVEAGIACGCFYIGRNWSGSSSSTDYNFYAYAIDGTPLDGLVVQP